jgi:thiol:disulfide interchange protein DsbD
MLRALLSLCAVLFALFTPARVSAQMPAQEGVATWSASVAPVVEASALLYEVTFEVSVTPGWHIYDLGPYKIPSLATGFDFSASRGLELAGEPYEKGEPIHKFDSVFGFETGYFEPVGSFGQMVQLTDMSGGLLAGEIEYQICRDEVGCIRGVWEFSIPIEAVGGPAADLAARNAVPATPPEAGPNRGSDGAVRGDADPAAGGNVWSMIILAVVSALFALGTPCVFPMIPMTVSFFMKDNPREGESGAAATAATGKARFRAVMFGVFIVAIFTLPVAVLILATLLGGGRALTTDIFNWLATHWIPNVIFFLVFMLFAASLLGAFEIRMPGRMVNRSDRAAERGGLTGVFFLALTLVLVSFSCTLPIVGGALVQSARGEFWRPIATMLIFSITFALPFTFFAFFPRIMERLPRSGGWLNSVKVILGLVEIALGLKFLSVADQTYHWGILDREVYLAIWIVVFTLLGIYLLGKIRFKYDSEVTHIGVGRLALAIAVFSFVVYLVPGMWGAPIRALSGYLPPISTQDFVAGRNAAAGSGYAENDRSGETVGENIKYADILHLPHGLSGYFDLEQGMARAREVGKPVFVDFTGHGCVNCREMEARVWVDPRVQRILREDYVMIALYADDRTRLPEAEWLTTPEGRVLKTLGRKNAYLIGSRYGVNAQPAYLLLNTDGELLAPVYGYDLDIEKYIEFLQSGLK